MSPTLIVPATSFPAGVVAQWLSTRRRHPGELELLCPSAALRLGRVQVAVAVAGDMMQCLELARVLTVAAERVEDFERLAVDDMDVRVALVRHIDELLLRVW